MVRIMGTQVEFMRIRIVFGWHSLVDPSTKKNRRNPSQRLKDLYGGNVSVAKGSGLLMQRQVSILTASVPIGMEMEVPHAS
jgi:hypothetical protein